jgi:hypothetical protein
MSFLSWLPSAASSILPSRHWSRTKSLHCTCRRFRIWIRTLLGFIRENTWFPSLKLKTSQSDGSAAERSASTDDVQLCSGSATQQTDRQFGCSGSSLPRSWDLADVWFLVVSNLAWHRAAAGHGRTSHHTTWMDGGWSISSGATRLVGEFRPDQQLVSRRPEQHTLPDLNTNGVAICRSTCLRYITCGPGVG